MVLGSGWSKWRRSCGLVVVAVLVAAVASCSRQPGDSPAETASPIKHLVVIFQENVSFDHYFGTYPRAANTDGQPFTAAPGSPQVDGLDTAVLTHNPNLAPPRRLGGPTQQVVCDQDHGYRAEQGAFHGGAMDQFVQFTEKGDCQPPTFTAPGMVMDYYDGNSVTALWNYAQHFAMSDHSYGTTFGPSAPGAINLISGQTHGVTAQFMPGGRPFPAGDVIADTGNGQGTLIDDAQPLGDDCSDRDQVRLSNSNKNIGDLLNAKGITWGFFEGGFKPTDVKSDGAVVCGASHHVGVALGGTGSSGALPFGTKADYIPHHEPFQYYSSTANPHHQPPSSTASIGHSDQANHQYDLSDFWSAASTGHLPSVSYLKAPAYQDGHAGYSDPLDEQQFLVDTINRLQRLPEWKNTAVVIAYDDSDGWYDHEVSPTVSTSATDQDDLTRPGDCGDPAAKPATYGGRCGYGPRLPLLVVSPYAKPNFVDHTVTDQTSILRFVEANWKTGRIGDDSFDARAGALDTMFDFTGPTQPALILDARTGAAS